MAEYGYGDPFAGPDLWASSTLLTPVSGVPVPPIPKLESIQAQWPEVLGGSEDPFIYSQTHETCWPEIASDIDRVEPGLETTTESSQSDDRWSISEEDITQTKQPPGKSWEQYTNPAFEDRCIALSGAGVSTFDAAIRQTIPVHSTDRPLKPQIFLRCLFQLGTGRNSTLFSFQADGSFSIRIKTPRMYGLTTECSLSAINRFGRCGQLLRSLKQHVTGVYSEQSYSASAVAAAQTVSSVLLELDRLTTISQNTESLLQLQNSFNILFLILPLLRDILSELPRLTNDSQVLTYLFDVAQEIERSEPSLKPLMSHIVTQASEPWLKMVTACVGLRTFDASSETMRSLLVDELELGAKPHDDDVLFPKWFSTDDRTTVRQTFEGMSLLARQGLTRSLESEDKPTLLAWKFSWEDFSHDESDTNQYNSYSSRKAVTEPQKTDMSELAFKPDTDFVEIIRHSYPNLEGTRYNTSEGHPELRQILNGMVAGHNPSRFVEGPSFEVAALNSFKPVLSSRAFTINHACMKELFLSEFDAKTRRPLGLIYHIGILNRLLLMRDGMFTTRLSHALFDPDLASAERSKGKVRYGNMGLRLGSRTTWPPASSELQLALMGILTSAFENEPSAPGPSELPGDLSFALRQLSEDEIQRCLDQSSLEALDFLRIQYRPAPPLDCVITPSILEKYDCVQRLLLRMIRLVFVVNHSSRLRLQRSNKSRGAALLTGPALKFLHAAHHFVTAFTDYLLNTAIAANWARLQAGISELETEVSQASASVGLHRGIAHVRALHERTLDDIMFACLLRKRHDKVRALLEDILRLILKFSALQSPAESVVTELYGKLKKQVGVFINVCKGLGAQKEYAGMQENGLQALVTRLTMNDVYNSDVERVLRL